MLHHSVKCTIVQLQGIFGTVSSWDSAVNFIRSTGLCSAFQVLCAAVQGMSIYRAGVKVGNRGD